MYLIPGLFWNTHDSHTFCPDATATGLINGIVCHPAVVLIVVAGVTSSLDPGAPPASA